MTDAGAVRVFSPGVRVAVPEGWLVRASVELVEPALEANVVVVLDEGVESASLHQYAEECGSMLEQGRPGYEEMRREDVELNDGRRAMVRRFRWRRGGGEPVQQLQVYLVQGRRALTATLSSSHPVDDLQPTLLDLVGGIALDGTAGGGGLVRVADEPRTRTYAALEGGELAAKRGDGRREAESDPSSWQELRRAWEESAKGGESP